MAYTPIPLKTQCLEKFGSFLYEQMAMLMDIYQDPSIRSTTFHSQYLEPLHRSLECYILTNVKFSESYTSEQKSNTFKPCNDMVNKFTKKILKQVLKSIDILKQQFYGIERPSRVTADLLLMCEQVAGVVGAAVYHPTSTILDLFKPYDYIPVSKIPKTFTTTFLEKAISKMNNLTSLNLRNNPDDAMAVSIVPKNMQNLRVFSYRNFCQDFTIFNLAFHCKHLTDLDVQGSKEVTDKSISYILNFKNLTSLQITGTGLSSEGISQILEGLPGSDRWLYESSGWSERPKFDAEFLRRESMFKLGFDLPLSNKRILTCKFKNLRSLQVNLPGNVYLNFLNELFCLYELDIGFDASTYQFEDKDFPELRNVFASLGQKLIKLVLRDVCEEWNDLQYILTRCTNLRHISLEFNSLNLRQIHTISESSIPEKDFSGSDNLPILITQFRRVRSWKLCGLIWRSDLFINIILQMAEREAIKTMKVNEYDMKFDCNRVNINSLFGARLSVEVCDFEPILKEILYNAEQLVILLKFMDTYNYSYLT